MMFTVKEVKSSYMLNLLLIIVCMYGSLNS